ncbi:MAG: ribosome silencing factor [Thermodesulfobacteriota bacterium]
MKTDSSLTPAPSRPSREKAEILLRGALSKKATDPVLLRLEPLTTLTDYFLIVSARSARQVKAIADAVLETAREHHIHRLSAEGIGQSNWALLDFGDVVVHVFHTPLREFYDLEGLWAEAKRERFTGDLAREIEAASETTEEEEE